MQGRGSVPMEDLQASPLLQQHMYCTAPLPRKLHAGVCPQESGCAARHDLLVGVRSIGWSLQVGDRVLTISPHGAAIFEPVRTRLPLLLLTPQCDLFLCDLQVAFRLPLLADRNLGLLVMFVHTHWGKRKLLRTLSFDHVKC